MTSNDVLIYLASPYSGLSPMERIEALSSLHHALAIMAPRLVVYSPIIHWHETAAIHSLPTDSDWWTRHNEVMLRASGALYVFEQPGWKDSRGVAAERAFMRALMRPESILSWHDRDRGVLALRAAEGRKPALYATKNGITESPY